MKCDICKKNKAQVKVIIVYSDHKRMCDTCLTCGSGNELILNMTEVKK